MPHRSALDVAAFNAAHAFETTQLTHCGVDRFVGSGNWKLATRLRNIEGSAQQQQKLEALGTMSAGLAHELNNPSSAAQRIAVHLGKVVRTIQSVAHRLHHTLEHEHWDR